MQTIQNFFGSWRNPIEVILIACLVYAFLRFLRDTRGEGILKGLALFLFVSFAGLYSLASALGLPHIEAVLNVIVQTSVVAIIVIFQQELRQALTKLGQTPFGSGFGDKKVVDEVVHSVMYLSKKRIGALIAFERQHGLKEYIEAGARIDSLVKSELLNTIFYVGTPLHDGAIIIQGDRIAAAGCGFRLTENPELLKSLGFRHRAGVGLTEDSDAVAVIVSEETGIVSVAVGGQLWRELDRERLEQVLRGLYVQGAPTVEAVFGMEEEAAAEGEDKAAEPGKPDTKGTARISSISGEHKKVSGTIQKIADVVPTADAETRPLLRPLETAADSAVTMGPADKADPPKTQSLTAAAEKKLAAAEKKPAADETATTDAPTSDADGRPAAALSTRAGGEDDS